MQLKKLTIYYEDSKQSCQMLAEEFGKYENVECKKASDYEEQRIIFTDKEKIGLIFESENGKVPDSISNVIQKIVADKEETHMICVTGGRKEFKALHSAKTDMEQRGLKVQNIYTKYLFQKHKVKMETAARQIISDLEAKKENLFPREKYQDHSKKELRKYLRRELREYGRYSRKQRASKRGKIYASEYEDDHCRYLSGDGKAQGDRQNYSKRDY